MTVKQIVNRIIKDINAFPEEARQSQDDGGPKTKWDEYKEQIQYEEYDSYDVLEETIESMVAYDISVLSEKVIENLYRSIHKNYYPADFDEKRADIKKSILLYLKREAESEDIEYNKPVIEFIRYYEDELTIIAEVLKKVGPDEYLINAYSEATSNEGEQGVVSLSNLDDENGLEQITADEFEIAKKSLWKKEYAADASH